MKSAFFTLMRKKGLENTPKKSTKKNKERPPMYDLFGRVYEREWMDSCDIGNKE